MYEMEKLITSLVLNRHPLVEGIKREEVLPLVEALRSRLGLSLSDLDLTPASLSVLSRTLANYHTSFLQADHSFSELENVRIIREITGYLVEVFRRNYGGRLENNGGLLGVSISKDGPSTAIKGNEVRVYKKVGINLGQLATRYWDAVAQGVERDLYKVYILLTNRHIKESL